MATKVSTLLDQIDNGTLLLPEFQRGYVWNRSQVRGLMKSLYQKHPVGSLLVWQASGADQATRGVSVSGPGYVDLLLDGQQRITTLYGIARGEPPKFFEGKAESFTGLHFNLDDESFEFYSPAKMKNDPRWVDVTAVMQNGIEQMVETINDNEELRLRFGEYVQRLTRIDGIKSIEFHVERLTGPEKTVDVVVEIFDRVNSGGTKLSKADLALSKLCAEDPTVRARLRELITSWHEVGFNFKLDWLLRVVNAIATGEAKFSALEGIETDLFREAVEKAGRAINTILNNLSSHLGIDHDRVLPGRYALPVMARYLDQNSGKFPDAQERDRLLYWYLHASLWGRFSGSVETLLNQDFAASDEGGTQRLVEVLESWRGSLVIRPEDFSGYSIGARFYPLLYILTRVHGAQDWWNGAPVLSQAMLGKLSGLQVHHIFPKARLYEANYSRAEVNSLANFCFLTQETNLWVTDRDPSEYFEEVEEKYPGALASQWIPTDRSLWDLTRYPQFLEARRHLLADSANRLMEGLIGKAPQPEMAGHLAPVTVGEVPRDSELADVDKLVAWLIEAGYAEPELDVPVEDPITGEEICIAEALWSEGLQEGFGEPVILELELDDESDEKLAALGFRAFPSPRSLREFVERLERERLGEALVG